LVASICDLPDVIICELSSTFRVFAAALLGLVLFLSLDQQSGIHCLIICAIHPAADSQQLWQELKTYLFAGHSKH